MRDYSRLATTAFARREVARTALVVGAGALGNEVIKNLALLGVRTIWIADRDHVEASNLTRSILFCTPEIDREIERGTPKAVFAARRVVDINPEVSVRPWVGEIGDLGYGVVRRADVVFSCLDNEMARLELSWACARVCRLLVDGGLGLMNYSSGQVTVFPGKDGPCYACRKGADRRRELLRDLQGREDPCWRKEEGAPGEPIATTPLMASVVGAIQVELGLRRASDGQADSLGRAYRITLHPMPAMEAGVFERSPTCSLHDPRSVVDAVHECPTARSDAWTPLDLFREADIARGCLALDWPMTAAARCRACGHAWEPFVRRARFRHQTCPACGGTDLAEVEVLSAITHDSDRARRTLSELGLPHAHVHEVADADRPDRMPVHVEVTGDLAAWLAAGPC